MIRLAGILDAAVLAAIEEALADDLLFADGSETAAGLAKSGKYNLQARHNHPSVSGVIKKIEAVLLNHALFRSAAIPKSIPRILISRYEPGMAYRTHVDNPLIEGQRADLSFTLFISPPDHYKGGELVIDGVGGEEPVKLAAGSLILYPATTLHRVEKVTGGIRLAAIGWVRSYIRSDEQREILFGLDAALGALKTAEAKTETRRQILNIRNKLLHMWTED